MFKRHIGYKDLAKRILGLEEEKKDLTKKIFDLEEENKLLDQKLKNALNHDRYHPL